MLVNLNENIGRKKVEQFRNDYKNGIPGLPVEYVNIVAQKLQELYDMGIVNPVNFTSLVKDSNNMVHIVEGKQAISKPVKQLLTTLGAYENLFTTPQLSTKRSVSTIGYWASFKKIDSILSLLRKDFQPF